ncbi:MAG: flagellar export chaperone FlgN [Chloroflexi bacterium]|nr:flagellar export chaperone FlgN [Chloroflexota bacterium]
MTATGVLVEQSLLAELRLTQTLTFLVERERDALQADDVESLAKTVVEKEECLRGLAHALVESEAVISAWGRELQLTNDDSTLEQVLTKVDRPTAIHLSMLRAGARACMDESRITSLGNQALLRVAMERNSALRDFLARSLTPLQSYDLRGLRSANDVHLMDWNG